MVRRKELEAWSERWNKFMRMRVARKKEHNSEKKETSEGRRLRNGQKME
jgi:hypothetical protein